jgi:hypothetical protein
MAGGSSNSPRHIRNTAPRKKRTAAQNSVRPQGPPKKEATPKIKPPKHLKKEAAPNPGRPLQL